MSWHFPAWIVGALFGAVVCMRCGHSGEPIRPTLAWSENMLSVRHADIPGGEVKVWYLEAYCRPGSTDRDWAETVIGHTTELVSARDDGGELRLRCRLNDGVVVEHTITAGDGEVNFRLTATNRTRQESQAHWAQPCVRVDAFTGHPHKDYAQEDYLPQSFLFVDGRLARLPLASWAKEARYTPGQVWCPKHVDRDDVNPRPLSDVVPSNGLIGCFSADEKLILASAWEPYQEAFQGVISCLHSDFRIGGLAAGETKQIRGKLYIVPGDADALRKRYEQDFQSTRRASDSGLKAI